jgi:alpha-L-fucosidase
MNEQTQTTYTAEDIRFTAKGGTLFATALGWPANGRLTIKSLGTEAGLLPHDPTEVKLLGHAGPLDFRREAQALTVNLPGAKPCDHAFVLKIPAAA